MHDRNHLIRNSVHRSFLREKNKALEYIYPMPYCCKEEMKNTFVIWYSLSVPAYFNVLLISFNV